MGSHCRPAPRCLCFPDLATCRAHDHFSAPSTFGTPSASSPLAHLASDRDTHALSSLDESRSPTRFSPRSTPRTKPSAERLRVSASSSVSRAGGSPAAPSARVSRHFSPGRVSSPPAPGQPEGSACRDFLKSADLRDAGRRAAAHRFSASASTRLSGLPFACPAGWASARDGRSGSARPGQTVYH